eukprot:gene11639-13589_t
MNSLLRNVSRLTIQSPAVPLYRKQPTHARKLRVRREHQTRENVKLKLHQVPIQDWRMAPQHHLPKFDASKVKPKIDYKARVDQMQDTANGWRVRQIAMLTQRNADEKQVLENYAAKREKRLEEENRLAEAKKEALLARQQQIESTTN